MSVRYWTILPEKKKTRKTCGNSWVGRRELAVKALREHPYITLYLRGLGGFGLSTTRGGRRGCLAQKV